MVILGSGTAVPSLERGAPGLLVEVGGKNLLIDGGSGTLNRLLKVGVRVSDIDFIFYSHLHPDHTADLVPLLFALRNPDLSRDKGLTIAGPPGFMRFFQGLKEIYGRWVEAMDYELIVNEMEEGEKDYTDFRLVAKEVAHIKTSLGFRIEAQGKSLAYSGDSDYCQALIELGRGADLFILECSFPDEEKVEGHLTPTLAGRIAAQAGCKRLVLTHFYPACEGVDIISLCKKLYAGEITLAHDLMGISL